MMRVDVIRLNQDINYGDINLMTERLTTNTQIFTFKRNRILHKIPGQIKFLTKNKRKRKKYRIKFIIL